MATYSSLDLERRPSYSPEIHRGNIFGCSVAVYRCISTGCPKWKSESQHIMLCTHSYSFSSFTRTCIRNAQGPPTW
eukprot:15261046-Heterocapsa_arctica.AAC.1